MIFASLFPKTGGAFFLKGYGRFPWAENTREGPERVFISVFLKGVRRAEKNRLVQAFSEIS